MNSRPAARGSQEAGFTQPRANLLADPCIDATQEWISYRTPLSNINEETRRTFRRVLPRTLSAGAAGLAPHRLQVPQLAVIDVAQE